MPDRYMRMQNVILCNLGSIGVFRAVIQNESLSRDFFGSLVRFSETDNGQVVSLLLEDGSFRVSSDMLDTVLKKDFGAMAVALERNDVIKAGIRMCHTCSENIGAYYRDNGKLCSASDERPETLKYCRSCALADNRFCKVCNGYLCSDCFEDGVFRVDPPFCSGCGRDKCRACILQDGENWLVRDDDGFGLSEFCPTCVEQGNIY